MGGMSPEEAFLQSSESITGNIVKVISKEGIKAVYDKFEGDDKKIFQQAYSASYKPAKEKVRSTRDEDSIPLNPFTAGVYVAAMMGTLDVLLEAGHPYSEVVNESVIEAVDSLCPYMHYKGVAFMVDNCSFTAKTGSRKWAPRFDYILDQLAFTAIDNGKEVDMDLISEFENHKVHDAIEECCKLRPSVDISCGMHSSTKEIVIE